MATFTKYKKHGIGRLMLHNNRVAGDGVTHSNEEIDESRTCFNYSLKHGGQKEVSERLQEVFRRNYENETVMGEIVVTLPKEIKEEEEQKFFRSVLRFFEKDFGEKNIINAVVHKDETTPHIHIDFIPVVKEEIEFKGAFAKKLEKWKETHTELERLCCKELVNREYLITIHPRLQREVEKDMGYPVGILNGATAHGNKTVLEMKNEALLKKIEKQKELVNNMEAELRKLYVLSRKCGFEPQDVSLLPLVERISILENQAEILQGIIRTNHYVYTKEQMASLRNFQTGAVKSTPLSVHTGSLKDASIAPNGIIVVEVIQKDSAFYTPQRPMFEEYDMERSFRQFLASREQVSLVPDRTTDNMYLFVLANTMQQTMANFILMRDLLEEEQEDLEGRTLYLQQFQKDSYHFAKNILEQGNLAIEYYIAIEKAEKTQKKEIRYE